MGAINGHHGLLLAGATAPASNVVSYLPLAADLTDLKGRAWSAVGGAAVSGGALQLDGVGDYLSTPNSVDFDFGSGEFCIEAFVTIPSAPNAFAAILAKWGGSLVSWLFGIESSRVLQLYFHNGGYSGGATVGLVPVGTEVHVASYRVGSNIYGAINGNVELTSSSPGTFTTRNTQTAIGMQSDGATSPFTGQVRHVRLTKGSSPYGATNFTPPTPPLPY